MDAVSANSLMETRRQMERNEKRNFDLLTRPHQVEGVGEAGFDFYTVHISLDLIDDTETRQQLQGVGTRLQLPANQVDQLVAWGRKLTLASQDYLNAVSGIRSDQKVR